VTGLPHLLGTRPSAAEFCVNDTSGHATARTPPEGRASGIVWSKTYPGSAMQNVIRYGLAACVLAAGPVQAFCIVSNGGCKAADGTTLVERDGQYVNAQTGEQVMDVPTSPERPMTDHYVSGPLNAAEGIATPIGRAGSADDDDGETAEQARDRRLRNAWSSSARKQVLRDEQRRIDRANRDPDFERRLNNAWSADTRRQVYREAGMESPSRASMRRHATPVPPAPAVPPPMTNTATGEPLIPSGGGHYTGTWDGRLYAPAGPNGIIDTQTGQFIPTH